MNIMIEYCPFSKADCIYDVSGVGCTPPFMLLVFITITYLSSFRFEIRSKYWHLTYDVLNIKPFTNQITTGAGQCNDISAEDESTIISRNVVYYSVDLILLGSSKPNICTIHC